MIWIQFALWSKKKYTTLTLHLFHEKFNTF